MQWYHVWFGCLTSGVRIQAEDIIAFWDLLFFVRMFYKLRFFNLCTTNVVKVSRRGGHGVRRATCNATDSRFEACIRISVRVVTNT